MQKALASGGVGSIRTNRAYWVSTLLGSQPRVMCAKEEKGREAHFCFIIQRGDGGASLILLLRGVGVSGRCAWQVRGDRGWMEAAVDRRWTGTSTPSIFSFFTPIASSCFSILWNPKGFRAMFGMGFGSVKGTWVWFWLRTGSWKVKTEMGLALFCFRG